MLNVEKFILQSYYYKVGINVKNNHFVRSES